MALKVQASLLFVAILVPTPENYESNTHWFNEGLRIDLARGKKDMLESLVRTVIAELAELAGLN